MKHCLIIEPSPIIRRVAAIILSDMNYRVEETDNIINAMAHCRIEMPDVVFIDLRMPDGAAISFLEQLQGLTRLRKPRLIVSTTINDPAAFKLAQNAGADDQILKPFDRRALTETLAQLRAAA